MHTRDCLFTYIYTEIYIFTHICVYMYTYSNTYIHAHTYTYKHVSTPTHAHTYAHTHTQTHISCTKQRERQTRKDKAGYIDPKSRSSPQSTRCPRMRELSSPLCVAVRLLFCIFLSIPAEYPPCPPSRLPPALLRSDACPPSCCCCCCRRAALKYDKSVKRNLHMYRETCKMTYLLFRIPGITK